MIRLKNIQKNDDFIICEIYPEDSKTPGKIAINIAEGAATYYLPEGYEWCTNHVSHAKRALLSMNETGKIEKEKTIMWV